MTGEIDELTDQIRHGGDFLLGVQRECIVHVPDITVSASIHDHKVSH